MTFTVIFCGHFTGAGAVFSKESVVGESRGHWYLRQPCGSSNPEWRALFHILTGNLSHQIEHHLFPTCRRLAAALGQRSAREIADVAALYSINNGSLWRQFATVSSGSGCTGCLTASALSAQV